MSKYDPLWLYLKERQQKRYQLSYEQIEKILGFPIDHSFLTYKKEVEQYGYQVEKISLKEQTIVFKQKEE